MTTIEEALRGLMRCMTDWASREDGMPEEYAEAMNAADTALYSAKPESLSALPAATLQEVNDALYSHIQYNLAGDAAMIAETHRTLMAAVSRYAGEGMRLHVEEFATRTGWKREGGEGAFEYVQRRCYETGREDAGEGWRPIESAPIDGNAVWVWAEDFDCPVVAWWSCDKHHLTGGQYWKTGNKAHWLDLYAPNPTHWMPLPAPPSKDQP